MRALVLLCVFVMVTGCSGTPVVQSESLTPRTRADRIDRSAVRPSAAHRDRVDTMSAAQLVHQLMVVPVGGLHPHARSAYNVAHYGVATPARVVRTFHPGGVIYFDDNVSSVRQVRRLSAGLKRSAGRTGLLIGADQEGGRVSRLPGPVVAQQPAARDFAGNARAARRSARDVGAAMRRMGVLVDFAPDADVDTVGDAGVIGDRSFGSTGRVVSRLVRAQICGYHAGGVATAIKHWPGHGSTRVDSHESLPTLTLSRRSWRHTHLPPFVGGIATGTDMVMVGHLAYPALDPSGRPATLSRRLNADWLRGRLDYDGVVITDSLSMGAIAGTGTAGEVAVRAFRGGADLLLMSPNPRGAVKGMLRALHHDEITRGALERSVRRVMAVKDRLGLIPGPRRMRHC